MMKNIFLIGLLCLTQWVFAQDTYHIQLQLPDFPNAKMDIKGYEGMQTSIIAQATSDAKGTCSLSYPANYTGAVLLRVQEKDLVFLVLNKENFNLYWKNTATLDSLKITGSKEYDAFSKGMTIFQDAEQKLAGWQYLAPLYEKDKSTHDFIAQQASGCNNAYPNYVKSLPATLFVRQYLLSRGLLSQMPKTIETYPWRVPQHLVEFMGIDFKVLKNAGLYEELLMGYTSFVERLPTKEAYPLLQKAIDKVLSELKDEPTTQQALALYWFKLLEKKSLFPSADYLANRMLSQYSAALDASSIDRYEQYRAMADGKIAPDISFSGLIPAKKTMESAKSLKAINAKYKLVVFGASWCPECNKEYPKLKEAYQLYSKKNDVEVVYISIDTDKTAFENYYKDAPFPVFFDGKGWDTQAAKDYHVFATPGYYLMDNELKIVKRIYNVAHFELMMKNLNADGKPQSVLSTATLEQVGEGCPK